MADQNDKQGDGGQEGAGQGGSGQDGGSGTGGSSSQAGQGAGSQAGQSAERKFSQADLDAIVQDRLARDRTAREKQFADYDDLKKKAADFDDLKKQSESDAEKRVREATEKARGDVLAEMRPQLVLAELRAAAAGRIDHDRFETLVDDLDLAKYLAPNGSVDIEKVRKKVDAWAPPKKDDDGQQQDQQPGPRRPRPDRTQGSGTPPPADAQRGIDEARRRFGDRARGPAATSNK